MTCSLLIPYMLANTIRSTARANARNTTPTPPINAYTKKPSPRERKKSKNANKMCERRLYQLYYLQPIQLLRTQMINDARFESVLYRFQFYNMSILMQLIRRTTIHPFLHNHRTQADNNIALELTS